jgi:SAM-dependent methyltransferase
MREDIRMLAEVYAAALAADGATPRGVLWPNAQNLATRFDILLAPLELAGDCATTPVKLLDLGCGPGLLLDYLAEQGLLAAVDYTGVDVFDATLQLAAKRWPQNRFELRDVRDRPFEAGAFDYCIICGAFTGRFQVRYTDMENLVRETLRVIWPSVRLGLGFNVMSKHVDWEREDLFHWPLDDMLAFCKADLSRHVSLRLDYGLWETAVFVRKEPVVHHSRLPQQWL